MADKTFYEILGIHENATQQEIKNAYRKLAHKYHPDKSNVSPEASDFVEMMEAYDVLKDPAKRQSYDKSLKRSKTVDENEDFHEASDKRNPQWYHQNTYENQDDFFDSILEYFFGNPHPRKPGKRQDTNHRHYDDLLD